MKLAIVIPAYKAIFFEKTLFSISNQTNKNFNLYIGDDCSPENLEKIVSKFKLEINISYERFNQNLGSTNLISHWNRCLNMTKNEEWIWLFSDDDIMDLDCVDKFYRAISSSNYEFDLYHFNIKIINDKDKVIRNPLFYPDIISSRDFYKLRLEGKIKSFAVEYIFKKEIFYEKGGFQEFDLAWGSDDATWIKIGFTKGIYTIKDTFVFWRSSNYNITPISKDIKVAERKLASMIQFSIWADSFFYNNKFHHTSKVEKIVWFIRGLVEFKNVFDWKKQNEFIKVFLISHSLTMKYKTIFFILMKQHCRSFVMSCAKYILSR